MIQRREYLNKLISWQNKNIIKVVTGVRRCGKSTLFSLFIEYLKSTGVKDSQIVSVNLEDIQYENLLDYHSLYNYVKEQLQPEQTTYIFIDEVQNCSGFEKAIDSLFIQANTDLYITGSNAYMLSGELATLLSGRYITIDMLPLSFAEYCMAKVGEDSSKVTKFNQYLSFGSFPYITSLAADSASVTPYLEGIYNTILVKDVAQREGIKDITLLESIVEILARSIGSPVSTKKISDTISSSGRNISVNTVDNYLRVLCDSYIFYKVERYDIKGRQYLKTLGKYYIVDTGLRNLLLSSSSADLGHMIENLVYLELRRRGQAVNVGKLAEKEVDFVTQDSGGIVYYQVAASVLDPNTLSRELEQLQKIPDYHPRVLLTLDEIGANSNHDGIRQRNLIDWLLGD